MSNPYRTAPPAEWPRSLRAAFLLGYKSAGSSLIAPLAGVTFSLLGGIGLGVLLTSMPSSGEPVAPTPPVCSIEATWGPMAPRGDITLSTPRSFWFDKTVAYVPDIDAALAAAGKVGCKVVP